VSARAFLEKNFICKAEGPEEGEGFIVPEFIVGPGGTGVIPTAECQRIIRVKSDISVSFIGKNQLEFIVPSS